MTLIDLIFHQEKPNIEERIKIAINQNTNNVYFPFYHRDVRMAERSKAPDSRNNPSHDAWGWAFWSPNGGVGSNPTSDRIPLLFIIFIYFVFFSTQILANTIMTTELPSYGTVAHDASST